MILIDGIQIVVSPMTMGITIIDISTEDTTRSVDGDLYIHKKGQKQKLELTFPPMNGAQLSQLLIQVKTSGILTNTQTFMVSYINPISNSWAAKKMYVGDRTVAVQSVENNVPFYKDFKMNFIEV